MEWKIINFKSQILGRKGEVLDKHIYKCGFCAGRGSKKGMKCSVCSGAGTINVQPPAVVCAYCDGSGRSYINRELPCIVCRGRGVVGIPNSEVEICPTCRGRGKEKGGNLPCLLCKGIGVICKK